MLGGVSARLVFAGHTHQQDDRVLAAGWPDARCVAGALTDPVEAIVVTRIFEDLARG